MIGTCVQIGLHESCEWAFLTQINWKEQWLHHKLPNIFPDITNWNYIGIDINPVSIAKMSKAYNLNKKCTFICSGIGSSRSISRNPTDGFLPHNIISPFITLGEILYRFGNIDILALDIEGGEYQIFNSLDFLDIPMICVEIHKISNNAVPQQLSDKIVSLGYKTGSTHDLTYGGFPNCIFIKEEKIHD